jgi:hypothetical protein
MNKQTIPTGSTVRVNAPTASGIHGKIAHVRSFNSAGINGSGRNVGIYDVMVEGLSHPSWLYETEMDVLSLAPTEKQKAVPMDREQIEYMADDLHRIVCQYNHIDECGYYNGLHNSDRKGWIGRAERTVAQLELMGYTDAATILAVVHTVERVR